MRAYTKILFPGTEFKDTVKLFIIRRFISYSKRVYFSIVVDEGMGISSLRKMLLTTAPFLSGGWIGSILRLRVRVPGTKLTKYSSILVAYISVRIVIFAKVEELISIVNALLMGFSTGGIHSTWS